MLGGGGGGGGNAITYEDHTRHSSTSLKIMMYINYFNLYSLF